MIEMRTKGFTLVEILIVVAIICLLAIIAIPKLTNFGMVRAKAQAETCIANLRQIESAIQVWAVDLSKNDTDVPQWADLVPNYIRTQPVCPSGGVYNVGTCKVSERPTCSYKAAEGMPKHVLP